MWAYQIIMKYIKFTFSLFISSYLFLNSTRYTTIHILEDPNPYSISCILSSLPICQIRTKVWLDKICSLSSQSCSANCTNHRSIWPIDHRWKFGSCSRQVCHYVCVWINLSNIWQPVLLLWLTFDVYLQYIHIFVK